MLSCSPSATSPLGGGVSVRRVNRPLPLKGQPPLAAGGGLASAAAVAAASGRCARLGLCLRLQLSAGTCARVCSVASDGARDGVYRLLRRVESAGSHRTGDPVANGRLEHVAAAERIGGVSGTALACPRALHWRCQHFDSAPSFVVHAAQHACTWRGYNSCQALPSAASDCSRYCPAVVDKRSTLFVTASAGTQTLLTAVPQ